MKLSRLFFAALSASPVLASLSPLRADDALPKAHPAAVYEPMAARSPFMAPTAPGPVATPAPVQAGPHWWDQMFVTSIMEAGGTYFAAVVDKANNKRYVLETGKADEDSHLLLANVQWSERAEQSTVTVRKGMEVAPPLRFDASAVPSAPASAPQPFAPPRSPGVLSNPPMPSGFTGTPPPPPPSTSVVRHAGPIGSRPAAPGNPGSAGQPLPPPPLPPVQRRTIRPLGGTADGEN